MYSNSISTQFPIQRWISGILLFSVFYFLMFSSSYATLINVPADQPSIEVALSIATTGDTVLVSPGVYEVFSLNPMGQGSILLSKFGKDSTFLTTKFSTKKIIDADIDIGNEFIIDGFTFLPSSTDGDVVLNGGGNVIIRNNLFLDYFTDAVYIRDSVNASVMNNIFDRPSPSGAIAGVKAFGASAIILNNTFRNYIGAWSNNLGTEFNNNIVINRTLVGEFSSIKYNLLKPTASELINEDIDSTNIYSSSANPFFVDEQAGNFELLPFSPAIDAGDPNTSFADPDGTRNDMGAIPFLKLLPFPEELSVQGETVSHLITNVPVFGWSFSDTIGVQIAFELEVGTDFDWSLAELWSTGIVSSTDSQVTYDGITLIDGDDIAVRVRLSNGVTWGSWSYSAMHLNQAATIPNHKFPQAFGEANSNDLKLFIEQSNDPEGDILSYEIQIYDDQETTNPVATGPTLLAFENFYSTSVLSTLPVGETYWWRSRTFDGFEFSSWSTLESFSIRTGRKVHVPTEWSSIQEGVLASTDGDSVFVGAGNYIGFDFNGKSINIVGELGSAKPVISSGVIIFDSGEDSTSGISGFRISTHDEFSVGENTAIQITNGSSPTITNNEFVDLVFPDIFIAIQITGTGSHATVTDNVFSNCETGLFVNIGASASATDNTFYGNTSTVIFDNHVASTFKNNIVSNSLNFGLFGAPDENDYNLYWNNLSDFTTGAVSGPNDIFADPLFNAPSAGDFLLAVGSPAIDAGDPDPIFSDDDGSQNDIGALGIGCCIIQGDANGDQAFNIADITFGIARIFSGGPAPSCQDQADSNGDNSYNIADITYGISRIFAGGLVPICGATGS